MILRVIFIPYYGTNTVTKIYYLKGCFIMNEKVEKYMEAYDDAMKAYGHMVIEDGGYDCLDSKSFDAVKKFMAYIDAFNELITYQANKIDEINGKLNRVLEK